MFPVAKAVASAAVRPTASSAECTSTVSQAATNSGRTPSRYASVTDSTVVVPSSSTIVAATVISAGTVTSLTMHQLPGRRRTERWLRSSSMSRAATGPVCPAALSRDDISFLDRLVVSLDVLHE